jgi:hypothetical protein
MKPSILPLHKSRDSRRREIQANWSPAERRARADAGRQRRRQLAELLIDPAEQEIWAVGAPGSDDLPRLAG